MTLAKKVGRPAGAVKTEKIEVKIRPDMKRAFQESLREKGSNASTKICEMIADYLVREGIDYRDYTDSKEQHEVT